MEKQRWEIFNFDLPGVKIMPQSDARIEDLNKLFDWDFSKAITDLDEIQARQEVFSYILANLDKLHEFLQNDSNFFSIPDNNAHDFMRYCQNLVINGSNSFWVYAEKLLQIPKENMPQRLLGIIQVIARGKDVYLQEEKDIAEAFIDELTKSIVIEGVLKLRVDNPSLDSNRKFAWSETACCGVKLLAPVEEKYYQVYKAPKLLWLLGRYIEKKVNKKRQERHDARSQKIEHIPAPILQDISTHFEKIFPGGYEFFRHFESITLEIYYRYDQNNNPENESSLKIRVLSFDYDNLVHYKSTQDRDMGMPDFHGLENTSVRDNITKIIVNSINRKARERFHAELKNSLSGIHSSLNVISSGNTREYYCTTDFNSLKTKYRDHLHLVALWHDKVRQFHIEFQRYYLVTNKIKSIADKYNLPLTMPEFSNDGNILEVSQFAPIRLAHLKRILPFNQFSVNGKMLNATGRNGSGKSTLLLSILDLCLMSQSGLPVFAQKARLSIKKYFLLSFLERVSDDSTFKAKLRKDMAVVSSIKDIKPEDRKAILAIIDELGSATSHESVMSVITAFANWLGKAGISAVLSTQISDFSRYMAENLGVKNFKIGTDFTLEEGIGEGEADKVAEEMGFFKLLGS